MHCDSVFKWRCAMKRFRHQPMNFVASTSNVDDESSLLSGPNTERGRPSVRPIAVSVRHRLAIRRIHHTPLAAHENARHTWHISPDFTVHFCALFTQNGIGSPVFSSNSARLRFFPEP